ncbi:Oxysterol-Binding Protein 2 [Manis pentadactyla]|nr:Oxysterol-Binding Protein 2 [Manis pentadactyla]
MIGSGDGSGISSPAFFLPMDSVNRTWLLKDIVLLGSIPGEEDKRQDGGKCILFITLSRVYGRAWNRAIQGEEERIAAIVLFAVMNAFVCLLHLEVITREERTWSAYLELLKKLNFLLESNHPRSREPCYPHVFL